MKNRYLLLLIAVLTANLALSQDTFTYEKIKTTSVEQKEEKLQGAPQEKMSITDQEGLNRSSGTEEISETMGDLSVSLTGGAIYNVPITVPPGISGVQPDLSLVYNSQGGNGLAGYGWNVSGLSVITRIPSSKHHDNNIDPVDFDTADRFVFEGQRLMLKSGTYGASGAIYETEKFSNVKITSYGVSPFGAAYGPSYFKVQYPDGAIAYYGYTNNSRSRTDFAITYWQNPQGIRISYDYVLSDNGLRINTVKYGTRTTAAPINTVQFIYGTRKRTEHSYVGGIRFMRKNLLKEIRVTGNGASYRTYILGHNYTSLGYDRLISVTEKSGDNTLTHSPITFNYTNTTSSVSSTNLTYNLSVINLEQRNAEAIPLDITGNGKMDFAVFPKQGYGKDKFWVFKDIQSGSSNYAYQVNTGAFEALFPVSWLTHNNKLLSQQGLALVQNSGSTQVKFKVYSNGTTTPIYYQYEKAWTPPTYTTELDCWDPGIPKRVPQSYISGDFNGDGLSDVIAIGKRYTVRTCNQGFGGGGPCIDPYEKEEEDILAPTEEAYSEDNNSNRQNTVGPVRDQRIDEIDQPLAFGCCDCYSNTVTSSKVHFINLDRRVTSGFVTYAGFLSGGLKSTDRLQTGDVNADGKTDIIHITAGKITVYTLSNSNTLQQLWSYSNSSIKNDYPILSGDYNGDGKTDFMTPISNNTYTFAVFLSTGTTYYRQQVNYPFQYKPIDWNGSSATLYGYNLIPVDINGDGRTDIIDYRTVTYNSNNNGNQTVRVYNNTHTTSSIATPAFVYGGYAYKYGNLKHYPIPIFMSSSQPNSNLDFASVSHNWVSSFSFSKDHREDVLLRSIGNNGVTNSITYDALDTAERGLDNQQVYQTNTNQTYPYVNIGVARGTKVVTGLTRSASGTTTVKQAYSYYAGVSNVSGLGFMGFEGVARSNWYTSSSDRIFSISKHNPQLRGATVSDYTIPYNMNFTSIPSNYINKSTYTNSSTTLSNKVFKLSTTSVVLQNRLQGTTTTKSFIYDSYNNPTRITTSYSGSGSKVENFTYANSTGSNYYIGRTTKKIVSHTIGSNTFTTEDQFTYSGALITQRKHKGHGTNFNTEAFTYDIYGNLTRKVITPYGTPSRTLNFQYDSSGRFLTKSIDAEGLQTIFTYNSSTGSKLTERNPYGLTTTYLYDSWNRLKRATDFLGKQLNTTYAESSNLYTVTTTGSNGSGEIVKYDRLKRKSEVWKKDVMGQWVKTRYLYDKFSRVYKQSEPYTGSSPSQWNETQYDFYGRIIRTIAYTGKTTNITYSGLYVTVNDGTKSVTTRKDGMGNVISVQDPGGTVTYTYYGNGNLKTTNYGGLTTTITQDGWGRKTRLSDPTAGIHDYQYNGFGETTKEITPKGTTTNTYNSLGRLTKRVISGDHTNMTVNYSYNSATKLPSYTSMTSSDGNNSNYTYTYDSYKRISTITENNPYARFIKRYTYDSHGQPYTEESEARYLSNNKVSIKKIRNYYTYGQLRGIKDHSTGASLWTVTGQNARGQVTNSSAGTGLVTKATFNSYGYFTKIDVDKVTIGNPGTTTHLMDLTYNFNTQRGTLTSRTNSMFGWNENFSYDSQDRLTAFNDSSGSKSQAYDTKGRITTASRLGTFSYSGNAYEPYQLSLNSAGQSHYNNYTRQQVSYNAFRKPFEITEHGKDKVTFQYNALFKRSNMFYGGLQTDKLQRRYRKHYSMDGSMEITYDKNTGKTSFVTYLGGDGYTANVIWHSSQTSSATNNYYYLHRDYQGSIMAITDTNGVVKEKRHFDAWGNIVKLTNGSGSNLNAFTITDRGYTGHEHIKSVGLVNMNARMYDPTLHRFLGPDNYIQDPFSSQNYNRYGYVLNNPLMYTDPSGNFAFLAFLGAVLYGALVGAAVAAVTYTAISLITGTFSLSGLGNAVLMGAVGGAISGGLSSLGSQLISSSSAFVQSGTMNMLSEVASQVGTSLAFGEDVTFGTILGSFAGGFAGAKLGNWSGVKGGWFKNAAFEVGFNSFKGAVRGGVNGFVGALIDGENAIDGLKTGAKNGAMGAAVQSIGMIGLFGATYKPSDQQLKYVKLMSAKYGVSYKDVAYRKGGAYQGVWNLLTKGQGGREVVWGRSIVTFGNKTTAGTMGHEFGHIIQSMKLVGWADFQATGIFEQFFIGPRAYSTPGFQEYGAEALVNSVGGRSHGH
ncbi:RHS repeat-associated core domain-containing protein [Ascidiimonas sp. W6]|uniref:RHS repeat-associated core domain-containing protein n=1 Tax=Ascidiimonas meishanensis TaxID=3128903 RepID=UPI0030EE200A